MTLHQVMIEALSRAAAPNTNIYMQDAYAIAARKLQKLIEVKGADCPVSEVSVQDVANIHIVNTHA